MQQSVKQFLIWLFLINKSKSSLICTSNDFISGILNNMSLLHYEQFWFQKRPLKLFRNKRFTLQNLFYFWHKKTNIVCICFSFHATFFAQWLPTLAKKWRTKNILHLVFQKYRNILQGYFIRHQPLISEGYAIFTNL